MGIGDGGASPSPANRGRPGGRGSDPDFSTSGTGPGERPRPRANRGRGRGSGGLHPEPVGPAASESGPRLQAGVGTLVLITKGTGYRPGPGQVHSLLCSAKEASSSGIPEFKPPSKTKHESRVEHSDSLMSISVAPVPLSGTGDHLPTHPPAPTHPPTHPPTHTDTQTRRHPQTHTHARARAHTHAHTHTEKTQVTQLLVWGPADLASTSST